MDIQERHQKRMEDVEAKVKKVHLENALLSEKVKQLSSENKDLNENIEELDKQHGLIVENLLAQKNQLQEKVNEAKVSVEALTKMKKDLTDLAGKHEKVENAYVASVQENITIKQQMEAINNELRRAVCENVELVAAMEVKNEELKNMMREKENLQREFQEFVVKMTTERDRETTTVKQLTDKIQFLEEDVQKSTSYSSEIQKKVLELSDELDHEKNEKQKVQQEFNAFREAEMHKNSTDSEKLEDQELQEMKKRFPVLEEQVREANQVAEDAKRSMREVQEKCTQLEVENKQLNEDLVALQEDDLTLQRNFHALEQIGTEKKQLQQDFTALQEEDLQLQRDYNDLKEKYRCLEEECGTIKSHMQEMGEKFQGNERDLAKMTEKCNVIAAECDQVKIERRQIEQDFIALQEDDLNLQREFHTFRNDNYQQLSEENNNLQRQIIDLQSKINIGNVEEVNVTEVPSSSVLELLRIFGGTSTSEDALKALEEFLKANQDTKFKLEAVEKRLTEAYAGVNQQKEEIRKLEHEKKTVQADLMHYEIECSELMKNNEILVQELEEIKSGKLETIQENSEEAVAMLEKQLEECNTINQGLENDIQMLNNRLDEMENNQEELLQKITQLEGENSQKVAKVGELRAQVSSLESEKSNLTFELMELKVEGSRSQDIEKYQNELQQLKHEASLKDQQLTEMTHAGEKMKETLDGLVKEKNELINLVTVKHNESLQYHAEIQRLSHLLQQEISKTCAKCPEFEKTLHDYQALRNRVGELETLPDQIDCLKEKSNLLATSLLEEQQNAKVLVREKQELRDKNVNLTRDLERLRQHLMSVEEDQTAQMVDLQRQTDEYKNKLTHLEQEAQKSSTAYTSASIRANQHAETLQAQYMLLTQQRDELSTKLSAAEDRESKNQAALINLQCALEQFQRDKDRDVEATTLRIRKHLEDERRAHGDVVTEVRNLQGQLSEAKTGLLAASRISDQLEQSQANLSAQKEELQKVQEKCAKLEQKLADAETNQADKVEKTLIKNLVIGYVSAPNVGDKSQILKLISAVLDFNQTESDRIGLKPSQAWGTQGGDETQGLAQAFVKFLEKESQPRQQPTAASLLNISHTKSPNPKTPPEPAVAAPVQPILLSDNILQALSPPRNSSTILKDILNDT